MTKEEIDRMTKALAEYERIAKSAPPSDIHYA